MARLPGFATAMQPGCATREADTVIPRPDRQIQLGTGLGHKYELPLPNGYGAMERRRSSPKSDKRLIGEEGL